MGSNPTSVELPSTGGEMVTASYYRIEYTALSIRNIGFKKKNIFFLIFNILYFWGLNEIRTGSYRISAVIVGWLKLV